MKTLEQRVAENKAVITNILLTLAMLSGFLNASWQSAEAGLQAEILYQMSLSNNWASGLINNTAELIFDTSIARDCASIPKDNLAARGSCGSNNFFLQQAFRQRGSLKSSASGAANAANAALADYRAKSSQYDRWILFSTAATIFLLIATIFVNSISAGVENQKAKKFRFFPGFAGLFIGLVTFFFVSAIWGTMDEIIKERGAFFLLTLSVGVMVLAPIWYWILRVPYVIGKEKNRRWLKAFVVVLWWLLAARILAVGLVRV